MMMMRALVVVVEASMFFLSLSVLLCAPLYVCLSVCLSVCLCGTLPDGHVSHNDDDDESAAGGGGGGGLCVSLCFSLCASLSVCLSLAVSVWPSTRWTCEPHCGAIP
eukprot:COSAG02_NODE_3619_length_6464_cov_15.210683_2_plen_107_part_00